VIGFGIVGTRLLWAEMGQISHGCAKTTTHVMRGELQRSEASVAQREAVRDQ
jgi:hypothetical protein